MSYGAVVRGPEAGLFKSVGLSERESFSLAAPNRLNPIHSTVPKELQYFLRSCIP